MGWHFGASVEFVLGILAHAPALAPPTAAPNTIHGKIIVMITATLAVTEIAWVGGVLLALPSLGDLVRALSHRVTLCHETVFGHLSAYLLLKILVAPLFCCPIIFAGGVILKFAESWPSVLDGALHLAGNILLVN